MFSPNYVKKSDGVFRFGKTVKARADACLANDSVRDFWHGFCCRSCELDVSVCDEPIFEIGKAKRPDLDGNSYAVNVESAGICIAGDGKKGLINGYMTLLHQIRISSITEDGAVFEIPCGEFKEKPRVANQMVHFCVFPETKLWELERFIKLCAALKYSHLVLEFWGMLQYDCLKELGWSFAFSKDRIRPLIKTANELGLEIIPMFNHWGHASASRMIYGKHVVLDQNPRLQPLFGADGWTWNIENPQTVKLLGEVRGELIDLCGEGGYFHIGCDEAYNFDLTVENYTVLTDMLNNVSRELAQCGRRPIIWGDMLVAKRDSFNPNNRYTASCKSTQLEELILSALDRNIIIADWQYNSKEAPIETALVFKAAGFDTLVCPWDGTFGASSILPCIKTAVDNDLAGVMHTTWNTLSIGMPDVCRAAFASWSDSAENNSRPHNFFAVNCAKILRAVFPVNGDYEKAGWYPEQIGPIPR